MLGPELVQVTIRAIPKIRACRQTTQSRPKKKKNAYVGRRDLEFEVGDKMFLKVAPTKGVARFRRKGKLSLCFIGSFEILEQIGLVAYQ